MVRQLVLLGSLEGQSRNHLLQHAGCGHPDNSYPKLQADIDYDAYCAYVVDRAALATLLASYIAATVLIFTLQQVRPMGRSFSLAL